MGQSNNQYNNPKSFPSHALLLLSLTLTPNDMSYALLKFKPKFNALKAFQNFC